MTEYVIVKSNGSTGEHRMVTLGFKNKENG